MVPFQQLLAALCAVGLALTITASPTRNSGTPASTPDNLPRPSQNTTSRLTEDQLQAVKDHIKLIQSNKPADVLRAEAGDHTLESLLEEKKQQRKAREGSPRSSAPTSPFFTDGSIGQASGRSDTPSRPS